MHFHAFSFAPSVTSALGGALLLLAACNPYSVDPTPVLPQDPAPDTTGPVETVGAPPQGQYDPSVLTTPSLATPASPDRSLSEQCYDYARAVVANNQRNDTDSRAVIGSGPTDLSRTSAVNQAFSQTSAEATYRDAYNTCMEQAQQQDPEQTVAPAGSGQPGAVQ